MGFLYNGPGLGQFFGLMVGPGRAKAKISRVGLWSA
jgi:hypothetical protein